MVDYGAWKKQFLYLPVRQCISLNLSLMWNLETVRGYDYAAYFTRNHTSSEPFEQSKPSV
jgi:hypothetical protein